MIWKELPFTNIIGEQSLRLKLEGDSFEIVASHHGVRIQGESSWFSDENDIQALALHLAKAFQFHKHVLNKKTELALPKGNKPKKLIVGEE